MFEYEWCQASTPLATNFKLSLALCSKSDVDIEHMSKVPYSSVVSSLIDVCHGLSRPYLSYAPSVVSRYMTNHGKEPRKQFSRFLIYVWGTSNAYLQMDLLVVMVLLIFILLVIWTNKITHMLCFHHWLLCYELERNFALYCSLFNCWYRVHGYLWCMRRSYLVKSCTLSFMEIHLALPHFW